MWNPAQIICKHHIILYEGFDTFRFWYCWGMLESNFFRNEEYIFMHCSMYVVPKHFTEKLQTVILAFCSLEKCVNKLVILYVNILSLWLNAWNDELIRRKDLLGLDVLENVAIVTWSAVLVLPQHSIPQWERAALEAFSPYGSWETGRKERPTSQYPLQGHLSMVSSLAGPTT